MYSSFTEGYQQFWSLVYLGCVKRDSIGPVPIVWITQCLTRHHQRWGGAVQPFILYLFKQAMCKLSNFEHKNVKIIQKTNYTRVKRMNWFSCSYLYLWWCLSLDEHDESSFFSELQDFWGAKTSMAFVFINWFVTCKHCLCFWRVLVSDWELVSEST